MLKCMRQIGKMSPYQVTSLIHDEILLLPRTQNFLWCHAWISSSILSLRVNHSSVVWPKIWWYRHWVLRFALGRIRVFLNATTMLELRVSSKTHDLVTLRGVYHVNLAALCSCSQGPTFRKLSQSGRIFYI